MKNEFNVKKYKDATVYTLESAGGGGTSSGSVASISKPLGKDQIVVQSRMSPTDAPKPRNFVAKNAKMGGAGQHKDKKKAEKQGDVKHKNKQVDMAEVFQNDESNLYYRYDTSDGKLKQRMVHNNDERQAFFQGFKDTPELALKAAGIIRSKFDPKKFVQNQGGKWVQVHPFGEQGVAEGSASHAELAKLAHNAYVQATRQGNGAMAAHYLKQHTKHKADATKEKGKQGVAEDDAGDVEQRFAAKMEKEKQRLAKLKQTDPEAYKREMAKRKTSSSIPPVSTFEAQGVAEGSESKRFYANKKQWQRDVDDVNHSVYGDESEYIGDTGRSTVKMNGREWARWSDAQQKGYIDMGSMSEQGVAEGKLGTAAALAGAIALGGAMGYKHATKDPNSEPTFKTKYERNAEVGAKLKKKIAGDQKNEGVAEGSLEEDKGMTGYNAFKREWRAKHGADAKVPAYDSKEYTSYVYRQNDKKQGMAEEWSQKYKSSINCSHPKGFSQKAHCAGKKKHTESMMTMEATCPDCGMCQTHGNVMEIKKGAKDSNGYTSCWSGYHAAGTKKGKNGGQVRNCQPNEGMAEGEYNPDTFVGKKGTYKGYGITQEGPSQWGISSSARKFTTLAAAKRHIDKNMSEAVAEDHEIQMASSELQSIAKNAESLLDMVRRYSEQDGLEAWQQSKITKAADYLNSVLQSISGEQTELAGYGQGGYDTYAGGNHGRGVAEGAVKELTMDLKSMPEQQFVAKYKKTKAEARASLKDVKEDAYTEALMQKLSEKIPPNAPVDVWIQDFQKADPNKYHQFKNKTPAKKAQMATAASYAAKNPSKK